MEPDQSRTQWCISTGVCKVQRVVEEGAVGFSTKTEKARAVIRRASGDGAVEAPR
jgi:hypothetical protein